MRGIVFTKLGDIDKIKIKELKMPEPKSNQVLIKVKTSSLNYVDFSNFVDKREKNRVTFLTMMMDLLVMPKLNKAAGMEVSGVVESVGKNVIKFKPGDEVIAVTAGFHGGWAEYVCASVNVTALKPSNMTFEEAATMCVSGISAYGGVHSARISKGQDVLVYGASGGVGQYTVQLAKMRGARVTGVCSTRNLEVCQRIGADAVIDYKKEDFSDLTKKYDVVLGINGNNPLSKYKKVLKKGGRYVAVGNMIQFMKGFMLGPFYSFGSGKKMSGSPYFFVNKQKSLSCLIDGVAESKIKPMIDKVYSVKEIKEAITYVVNEHPQGKVVIKIDF